ncbi:MAG: hypothetical protein LV479_04380 [Methylacidiphilales bacterium]|nr:hypothetical protein [Candidatus Methylacidiphilales bacterium]
MNTPKKRHHLATTSVKFRPNALRHGYASYQAQLLLPPAKVAEAMGATGQALSSRHDVADLLRVASADLPKVPAFSPNQPTTLS